jgi:diguanylate cyclase (GGDEF)-like protein
MTASVLDPADLPDEERPADWPVPADEPARLAALRAFGVLDQPRQGDLDAAARLAAYVCGTSSASINLIDSDRQWQAAAHGTEPGEVSRADAMCQHTVLGTEVVYTPDARSEALFADNPFVTGGIAKVRLYASAPLVTSDGHSVGTVCAFDERPGQLDATQLALLRDIADQVMALFELRRLSAGLRRAATRDPLTGLANRRAVETAMAGAIARAERGLGTPSVVMADLNGFKAINDSLGHAAGDAVLTSVAQRLQATARGVDTVGRLGGDEFVVLLEHTGGPGATAALSRLRRSLEGGWSEVAGEHEVEAALGITTYRAGDSVATLLARADAEMYADKARRAGTY